MHTTENHFCIIFFLYNTKLWLHKLGPKKCEWKELLILAQKCVQEFIQYTYKVCSMTTDLLCIAQKIMWALSQIQRIYFGFIFNFLYVVLYSEVWCSPSISRRHLKLIEGCQSNRKTHLQKHGMGSDRSIQKKKEKKQRKKFVQAFHRGVQTCM